MVLGSKARLQARRSVRALGDGQTVTNERMARSYLEQAKPRLNTAELAFGQKSWAFTVRQSQECVELSLKGALNLIGIDPPKWHDVGLILRREGHRFPATFRQVVDELALISRTLRRERELSMYGDEELGLTPDEVFSTFDAQQALEGARRVFAACADILSPSPPEGTAST